MRCGRCRKKKQDVAICSVHEMPDCNACHRALPSKAELPPPDHHSQLYEDEMVRYVMRGKYRCPVCGKDGLTDLDYDGRRDAYVCGHCVHSVRLLPSLG